MTFAPTRYTPPLTDEFKAGIDWYLPIIKKAWATATPGFEFDDWQIELLRRITELLPSGELRWRSVLVVFLFLLQFQVAILLFTILNL
jgi:hypothetical protein